MVSLASWPIKVYKKMLGKKEVDPPSLLDPPSFVREVLVYALRLCTAAMYP